MSRKKTVYIVPRWAATEKSDWYRWLKAQLEGAIAEAEFNVHILSPPHWGSPKVEETTEYLLHTIPPEKVRPYTYFIGHSVGCQAILRYLERQYKARPQQPVSGVLFVAAWFSIDRPWGALQPWIEEPVDFISLQKAIPKEQLHVLLSDNDPFTTNYTINQQLWEDRLNANVYLHKNQEHFNQKVSMPVLEAFVRLVS